MNLLKFITHIHYKLQQNAETAFFPNDYILEVVNKALIYVYNYADWSWTLVVDKVESSEAKSEFTMNYEIYKPYYFFLDGEKYERTNIPVNLLEITNQANNRYYTIGKSVIFSKKGKSVVGIYHRGAPQYDRIDAGYEIDIPKDMIMALEMCVLRYIHPGGFEQGAQLSQNYFAMMKEILDRQKKITGFTIKPDDIKLDRIYDINKVEPFTYNYYY